MSRWIGLALVLGCLAIGCKKPTCKNALEHGIDLVMSDPNAPGPLKGTFSRDREAAMASGIAACEENKASKEALQCMLDATTFVAFRACDRAARGHAAPE